MKLVQVAGGLIVVVLVLAFLVRGRFGAARSKSTVDTRPTLPPSPYQPSRGFKILDGSEPVSAPPVQLPRLDPSKEFVFGDPISSSSESTTASHLRHDEKWALDRSMRRAPHPRVRRRRLAWVLLALVLAAGIITALWLGVAHTLGHHTALLGAYRATPISWMM